MSESSLLDRPIGSLVNVLTPGLSWRWQKFPLTAGPGSDVICSSPFGSGYDLGLGNLILDL
jgi:hypothetical protein